jgi:hypothetical protein
MATHRSTKFSTLPLCSLACGKHVLTVSIARYSWMTERAVCTHSRGRLAFVGRTVDGEEGAARVLAFAVCGEVLACRTSPECCRPVSTTGHTVHQPRPDGVLLPIVINIASLGSALQINHSIHHQSSRKRVKEENSILPTPEETGGSVLGRMAEISDLAMVRNGSATWYDLRAFWGPLGESLS